MKTVYIVTSGAYSDYSVEVVFETKKAAEAHARQDSNFNAPEAWTVIEKTDPMPSKLTVYGASAEWMNHSDGSVRTWSFDHWDYELGDLGLGGRKKVCVREGDAPAGHYIRVWSLDAERAKKVCAEYRDRYLSTREGIA